MASTWQKKVKGVSVPRTAGFDAGAKQPHLAEMSTSENQTVASVPLGGPGGQETHLEKGRVSDIDNPSNCERVRGAMAKATGSHETLILDVGTFDL